MDEGRPTDPAPEPAFAPAESFGPPEPTESPLATEPVDPVDVEPIVPRRPGRATIALVIVLILAFISFAVVGGRILIAGPETPPPEPRLAVTDAAGHLHTMDAKGGDVVDYPVADVEFGFPTWSPDGTRIAVTGDDKDSTAIYRMTHSHSSDSGDWKSMAMRAGLCLVCTIMGWLLGEHHSIASLAWGGQRWWSRRSGGIPLLFL